jgi:hypothetical protein
MRRLLIRFLIFGLLGPAGTYFGVYLTVRTAARWWWPQPSIYVVELVPFLLRLGRLRLQGCARLGEVCHNGDRRFRRICPGMRFRLRRA